LNFSFIRYTQPGWQFNFLPITNEFASCCINKADADYSSLDTRYQTESAQLSDLAYRLFNKGVLLTSTQKDIAEQLKMPTPSLNDEYIFIRKYWGTAWASFALFLRILTLKNPLKEIYHYLNTRSIKRINIYNNPVSCDAYDAFQSSLIISEPLVAVIIPTLNRYDYLKDVLHDLEKQSYKNFEVIIVDQSNDFNEAFYKMFQLNIKAVQQKEKKLWTARNNAIKLTNANYLLFFDDDSRVDESWIEHHLKCIDFFKADISAGVSLAVVGQKIPQSYAYFRWADQFDSGNAMVHRNVFKQIGLFDKQFNGMRMGDGEFGMRAYKNGFKSISNHKAPRVHLKVNSGGLREMGSWDGFRPKKWFAPKPIPSVIYLFEKYFNRQFTNNAVFIGIMLSNVAYKNKGKSSMLLLSVVLTIIKSPVLFIQYQRSKNIAKKMLQARYKSELLNF
jgi:glycosyltransferase involved in cell wall biosynthesis